MGTDWSATLEYRLSSICKADLHVRRGLVTLQRVENVVIDLQVLVLVLVQSEHTTRNYCGIGVVGRVQEGDK